MHFTKRTWRPPYEKDSCIIELTSGCTYRKCHFCSLYKDEPFHLTSLEEFEQDLDEIKHHQPNTRRIFVTGANPFALSYEKLKPYVLTVRDYLIKCQIIAMFASIRDIKNKEVWQLKKLRAMGVNGLSIGTESGEDDTLLLANKGYTSRDIVEQCRKLEEAGIEYYFVYMTGLAGKGGGYRAIPEGRRGKLYSGRGDGAVTGAADIYQKLADSDTFICRFKIEFLSAFCLLTKGKGQHRAGDSICAGNIYRRRNAEVSE